MELAALVVSFVVLSLCLTVVMHVRILTHKVTSLENDTRRFGNDLRNTWSDIRLATQSADRAYTMASTANIALAISQKQLLQSQKPDPERMLKNELSALEAEAAMMAETNPFLEPLLSDEQMENLDKLREKKAKELKDTLMNGAVK